MADIRPVTHRVDSDHAALYAAHVRRIAALDPCVRVPPFEVLAGDRVVVARAGDAAVVGLVRREDHAVDTEPALSGPRRQVSLTPFLAGGDVEVAWDRLLTRWSASLADGAAPGDVDSGAVVTVASHDTALARPLLRHGFAPSVVTAMRRRRLPGTPRPVRDRRVRPATDADLERMVELAVALHADEVCFGAATERAAVERLLWAAAVERQRRSPGWGWVVDAGDGGLAGFVTVDPPEHAGWAASLVAAEEVGYVGAVYVRPSARRAGVGGALAAAAHRALDERGVGATLARHAVASPVAGPFWARHGYRPLWTSWLRRPATPGWSRTGRSGPGQVDAHHG